MTSSYSEQKPVDTWTVDDVASWLDSIGLGHKAADVKSQGLTGKRLVDESNNGANSDLGQFGFSGLQARKVSNRLNDLLAKQQPTTARTATYQQQQTSNVATNNEMAALKQQVATLQSQVQALTQLVHQQQRSTPTPTIISAPKLAAMTTYSPTMEYPSISVPGFCRACRIIGQPPTQILEISLGPGDEVHAEPGRMMHRSNYVHMQAKTGGQGFERFMTGSTIFVASFTYTGGPGTADTLVVTPDVSGQIIPIRMKEVCRVLPGQYNHTYLICQKGSLLCSSPTVRVDIETTDNFATGLLGGEGFILQGLRGPPDSMAFLQARGFLQTLTLAPGQIRWVSTGGLVAMESTVRYKLTSGGASLGTRLVGGEGFFLVELIGPGRVWLESFDMTTLERLIKKLDSS
jgi:uncharacterized protein (AIM24 family)